MLSVLGFLLSLGTAADEEDTFELRRLTPLGLNFLISVVVARNGFGVHPEHSGPKCVGFVYENQPPTRQVDFGEAQGSDEVCQW